MSNPWSGNRTDKTLVNSGNQFEPNDAIVAADINACFNNAFYAQEFVDDISAEGGTNVGVTGTPSVTFNNETRKFTFNYLKGATGAAAGFGTPTATAVSGDSAGVTITSSGQNTAKVFNFAFTLPRGATGSNGAVALTCSTIVSLSAIPVENATFTVEGAYFNRTPSVGEVVNIVGTKSSATYMIVGQVTAYTVPNATIKVLASSNIRGAQGAAGQNGSNGTAAVVNDSAYNKINFDLSGTTLSITVTAV